MSDPNSQQRLARFLVEFPSASITPAAREIARLSLLDTLAVALAGRNETASRLARGYTRAMRQDQGATAWLTGEPHLPEAAALFNAVAAHALDYDDVTQAWRGHPGAVIWPALWAAGQIGRSTFGELLDAYALGFEVGAQIGAAITAHHYPAGWHATSTVGILAAAAACSRTLKLDAREASHALGLAVAQSAGVQANFGTLAKPFQAGFAACGALRAALLAKAGVDASCRALEGPTSFGSLYGATHAIPLALPERDAGADLAIARIGIEIKQFPNCYAAHRAIEAALALRARIDSPSASHVRAILIEGTPSAHAPLLDRLPVNADEARFSIEFGVACALADGALRLDSFTDQALQRPDIRKLMSSMQVRESLQSDGTRTACVSITLADGRQLAQRMADLPCRYGQPAFMQRLLEKVADCLRHAGLSDKSQALFDDIIQAQAAADLHCVAGNTFQAIFSAHHRAATR